MRMQWFAELIEGRETVSARGTVRRFGICFFFSSRRRHTRYWRDWSSDVCSSDLGVAALEVAAQRPALDCLGQDHRRLALVVHRRLVGRVHLPVVVPAAGEVPDLLVAHALDELARARVAAEEVLADERTVLGLVGLVVAVGR